MAQLNKNTSIGDITDVYDRLKNSGGGGISLPDVVTIGAGSDFTIDVSGCSTNSIYDEGKQVQCYNMSELKDKTFWGTAKEIHLYCNAYFSDLDFTWKGESDAPNRVIDCHNNIWFFDNKGTGFTEKDTIKNCNLGSSSPQANNYENCWNFGQSLNSNGNTRFVSCYLHDLFYSVNFDLSESERTLYFENCTVKGGTDISRTWNVNLSMKNCILEGNLAFKTTNSYYKYCFDHCVFKNSIGDFSTAFVTMASMSYAWFKNCYLYESFENLFQGTGIATHCNIINSYLYISESSSSSSSYVLISNTDEYGGTTNVEIINSYIQGCNLGITDRIDCFGYWSSFCKVGDYSKMPNKTTCVEAELKVPPTDFFLLSKVKTENKA